jgi:hypothetical protein
MAAARMLAMIDGTRGAINNGCVGSDRDAENPVAALSQFTPSVPPASSQSVAWKDPF